MLHTNVSKSTAQPYPYLNDQAVTTAGRTSGPMLVPRREAVVSTPESSTGLLELAVIVSRRCSSFFAEAAVLVLVFGILDFFMLKGRIELAWILGALAISVGLLAASIATDFTAQRWIKAHP